VLRCSVDHRALAVIMPRSLPFLFVALLWACGDRTPAIPELAPFTAAGCAHCAQAGDLVLGGQPTPGALRALAERGFRTIVSTRAAGELDWDEQAVAESLGMRFVRIPLPLPVAPVTAAQIAALDTVLAASDGPLFLHCAAGTRAAVLWARWLQETRGLDPATILARAESAGVRLVQPATRTLLDGR
jgi:uncharacterized protein (TIGR01244 family)